MHHPEKTDPAAGPVQADRPAPELSRRASDPTADLAADAVIRARNAVMNIAADVAHMGKVRDEVDRSRRKAVVELKAARAKLAEAEANAAARGIAIP